MLNKILELMEDSFQLSDRKCILLIQVIKYIIIHLLPPTERKTCV